MVTLLRSRSWRFNLLAALALLVAAALTTQAVLAGNATATFESDSGGSKISPDTWSENGINVTATWSDFRPPTIEIADRDRSGDLEALVSTNGYSPQYGRTLWIRSDDGSPITLQTIDVERIWGGCNYNGVRFETPGASPIDVRSSQRVTFPVVGWTDIAYVKVRNIGSPHASGPNRACNVWIDNISVLADDTKAGSLGIDNRGIQNAPGLEKEWNPTSSAADNAGKK